MPDIMRTVLLLSLCGTALAVLLAVLRRLLKNRLPKALFYYLWLLVLLRLALPVALPVPGLELTLPEPRSAEAVTPPVSVQAAPDGMVGQPIPFDPSYVQTVPADTVITGNGLELSFQQEKTLWYRSVWTFLCENFLHIWLAGAAIHFLWFAVSYFRFCRSLKQDCLPLWEHEQALLEGLRGKWRVEACRSPLAQTPMLVGLIRPRIILPETAITTLQLECILRHELTHLRRRDLLYKWFTVAVTSFHWFNPLMPWLRREIARCCELSCDEAVIGSMNEDWKRTYGETLLALAAVHALPRTVPATTLCEEKAQLKERLVGIMKHKKVTAAILLLSCLLALLVAGCAAVLGPNAARRELPQAADYDLWIQADQKETFVRNWKAEYHDGTEVASVHFAPKDHSGDDYVFRGRDLPALRARVEAWAFAELPLDRDNCILYYQMEPELLLAASSQITVFPLDGGEPARMELSQLDMSTYCGHVTVTDLGDNGVWLVVLTDGDRAAQADPTEPADPNQIAVLDLTGRVAVLIENAPLDNAFAETVDAEGRTVVMDMALTLRKGDLVWVESQEGETCAVTVLAGEPPLVQGQLDVSLLSVEQTELEKANQVILKNAPQWVGPNEGLFAGAAVSGVANVEERKDNWYCVTLPGGDNAFWVRREDIVFDAYILPWNDPEDSRKRFGEILWNASLKGELPDGSKLAWMSVEEAAENHFTVTDIDGDGRQELLLFWTEAYMAGSQCVIYDYHDGVLWKQGQFFPSLRF
ncbi:MAG: M56 family metallopeptidase, partial [Butyricicoccaceae bacterium]